ncbi:MAG: methylated-DNA--[protein]-cysteine S-methyltransferase [Thermoplasmata archaeon]
MARIDFFPSQNYELKLSKFFDVKRDDSNRILNQTKIELKLYFDGKLKKFDIPLDVKGTQFQKKVWNFILTIPYGEVVSYSFIAKSIGSRKAFRAVGNAVHANPVPIVIPCHRVIGKNGSLTGYSSGLKIKKRLLNLECGYI